MKDIIVVYSGKDLKRFKENGGIGYWIMQTNRIRQAKYVLVIRNLHEDWSVRDDGFAQGQAFLVGKITGCKKHNGRKLILISDYIELSKEDQRFSNAWKKLTAAQRYPVAYLTQEEILEKLAFDIASPELNWHRFESESLPEENIQEISQQMHKPLAEVIAEAKDMIATTAGVDSSKVSIQINY